MAGDIREVFVSLTHGALTFATPLAFSSHPACTATVDGSLGVSGGGILHATDGAQSLRVRCSCSVAHRPVVAVNVTLTIRTLEHTSPSISWVQMCGTGTGNRDEHRK